MSARRWGGHRATKAREFTLHRDGGICWMCGHPGANSLDHYLPRETHPELTWEPSNWKAAHLGKHGRPTGCQTPGCLCVGNIGRQHLREPVRPYTTAPPSRDW